MKNRRKIVWIAGVISAFALGVALVRAPRAEEQPPEKPLEPQYQFRAQFVLYTLKDPAMQGQTMGLTLLQSVFMDPPVEPDVLTPRGYWRRTPYDKLLRDLAPDPEKMQAEDPAVVEEELSRIDGRFNYQCLFSLADHNKLGELMIGSHRSAPVVLRDTAGLEIDDPEAALTYDVTVVVRVQQVYEDGYALMHYASACSTNRLGGYGAAPLYEIELESIHLAGSAPTQSLSFRSQTTGTEVDAAMWPGHLLLLTVWPYESNKEGPG